MVTFDDIANSGGSVMWFPQREKSHDYNPKPKAPFYYEPVNAMRDLAGATIRAIWIDGDEQHYFQLDTDKGTFHFRTEGDCCSETWIYHIQGVDALLGHEILNIEEIDAGDVRDGYSRQEYDQLYCYKFQTTGGWADLEFRNSSNGYYGGELFYMGERPIPDDVRMIPVTDDYMTMLTERD